MCSISVFLEKHTVVLGRGLLCSKRFLSHFILTGNYNISLQYTQRRTTMQLWNVTLNFKQRHSWFFCFDFQDCSEAVSKTVIIYSHFFPTVSSSSISFVHCIVAEYFLVWVTFTLSFFQCEHYLTQNLLGDYVVWILPPCLQLCEAILRHSCCALKKMLVRYNVYHVVQHANMLTFDNET